MMASPKFRMLTLPNLLRRVHLVPQSHSIPSRQQFLVQSILFHQRLDDPTCSQRRRRRRRINRNSNSPNKEQEDTFPFMTSSPQQQQGQQDARRPQQDHTQPNHWVFHFDINETILIGDEAGGDSVTACLNKIIAKSALVQYTMTPSEETDVDTDTYYSQRHMRQYIPTHWWDGTPLQNTTNNQTIRPPTLYPRWTRPIDRPSASDTHKNSSISNSKTCPYYHTAFKDTSRVFTQVYQHGSCYRSLYHQIIRRLHVRRTDIDDHTGIDNNNNKELDTEILTDCYHDQEDHPIIDPFLCILPAFFHTCQVLHESTKTFISTCNSLDTTNTPFKYTLVLRTMGSDLERIMMAMELFAQGQHPQYPTYNNPAFIFGENKPLFRGRWRRKKKKKSNKGDEEEYDDENDMDHKVYDDDNNNVTIMKLYTYQLFAWDDILFEHPIVTGDEDIVQFIESHSIIGIQDDYEFWYSHHKKPWAGKPIWIHLDEEEDNDDDNNDTHKKEGDEEYKQEINEQQQHQQQYENEMTADTTEWDITAPTTPTTVTTIDTSSFRRNERRKNTSTSRHIFFDDNIHNDPEESIVGIRCKYHKKKKNKDDVSTTSSHCNSASSSTTAYRSLNIWKGNSTTTW